MGFSCGPRKRPKVRKKKPRSKKDLPRKMPTAEVYLRTVKPRTRCNTCQLIKTRRDLGKDIELFGRLWRDWGTDVGCDRYVREYLWPVYKYPLSHDALMNHLRKCLGMERER